MFAEVKSALPVSGDDYDGQIISEINACVLDLTRTAEIILPGSVSIKREQQEINNPDYEAGGDEPEKIMVWVVTDNSTMKDALIIAAISTWCNMRIGNPPNYEQLLRAYNTLKGQLRLSKSYTDYGQDKGVVRICES